MLSTEVVAVAIGLNTRLIVDSNCDRAAAGIGRVDSIIDWILSGDFGKIKET